MFEQKTNLLWALGAITGSLFLTVLTGAVIFLFFGGIFAVAFIGTALWSDWRGDL